MSEIAELLGDGQEAAGVVGTFTAPTETSATVLRADRWTQRTGKRLAGEWAVAGVEGIAADEHAALATDAVETLLAARPVEAERPADERRARWWKQLMETPECTSLRSRTIAQPAIAEIAAAELARQWVTYAAENQEPENPEEESAEQAVNRIRSTRQALREAAGAAECAEAVGAGLGLGNGSRLDASRLASYTRRLRSSPNLAAVMRMAGRFMAKAERLQRQRLDLPGLEITGVELSGDLNRLLPIESSLVAGAVPELEMLALARLSQRRSLSYRRILREPVAMGPIVVSIDESGSMFGEPIAAAKGLALAMASIARAQKRPFAFCAFSGTPQVRVVDSSAPTEAIVDWLEQFMNGGTVLDGPLHTLPTTAWPAGRVGARSDHIIITDDNVDLPDELRDSYRAWARAHGVRTFGIGIGVRNTESLAAVSDGGVWCLPSLDLDNPAIDMVLSIGPTHHEVRAA